MKFLKQHLEIFIIFIAGLILRLYYAHLDPYLHEWDERYHALVARNMVDNFFIPKLIKNPIVPYDIHAWSGNSIWLHKQPLFMWQMSLSMKLFGSSEFTMRLPSVLMGAISILLIYRITLLLTANKTVSILSASLLCFSHYQLEMISGQIGMDHNDVAFSFYILASFWAFSEKLKKDKFIWTILIGLFAGCAILNKWLVGLLVFLPYGFIVLQQLITEKKTSLLKDFCISLFCCVAISLPWQLYILHNFKILALHEYNYNAKHIFEAVEGHTGDKFFYFDNFKDYFGEYLWILIFIGILLPFTKKINFNARIHFAILVSLITVFIFFSFIVQSKLPTYFFIVVPFGIIYIAIALNAIFQQINSKLIHYFISFIALYLTFNPQQSIALRKSNPAREHLLYNTNIYKNVTKMIPPYVKVVINTNSFENIDVMFYNNNITAYHWWIDVKYLDSLKNKKVWIAAFKNHGDYNLPSEYNNYPYLYIIDTLLH